MEQDEENMNDDNQSLFAANFKKSKQKFLNNIESDSEEMTFSDEEEFIDDEQVECNEEADTKSDNDDLLPIEKVNKKLKKKKQEEE